MLMAGVEGFRIEEIPISKPKVKTSVYPTLSLTLTFSHKSLPQEQGNLEQSHSGLKKLLQQPSQLQWSERTKLTTEDKL